MNFIKKKLDMYAIRDEELKLNLQKFLIKIHQGELADPIESEEVILKIAKKIELYESQIEKLEIMAYRDPLTKILNRRGMQKKIYDMDEDSPYSVVIVDTDNFKGINDTFGHETGDVVLKIIAETIGQMVGENDIFGRLGGDEFLIALHNSNVEETKKKCDAIGQVVGIIGRNKAKCEVGLSFGIAACESKDLIFDTLKYADSALYESKEHGKNQASIYEEEQTKTL